MDLENVRVIRNPYAVKAVIPLDILITAASIYLLEKFVLDPLLNPIASKLNWATAVKKLLKPHQPINLTIKIRDRNFIEAPIDLDHELASQIWQIIRNSLLILDREGLLEQSTMIRITSGPSQQPLIIAYKNSRPFWTVDLPTESVSLITEER